MPTDEHTMRIEAVALGNSLPGETGGAIEELDGGEFAMNGQWGAASAPSEPTNLAPSLAEVVSLPRSLSRQRLLIRAVATAARLGHRLDRSQLAEVVARLQSTELRSSEKTMLTEELERGTTLEELAKASPDLQTRAEVFAVSVRVVDQRLPHGRVYLDDLAEWLALPVTLARRLREGARAHQRAA